MYTITSCPVKDTETLTCVTHQTLPSYEASEQILATLLDLEPKTKYNISIVANTTDSVAKEQPLYSNPIYYTAATKGIF